MKMQMDGWIDLNFDFLSQSISQTSSQSINESLSLKNSAAFCIPNIMQCAIQLIFMKAKSTTNNNRYNRINKAPHKCSFYYNLFCIVLYLCVCMCAWKKQRNASTLLAVLYLYTWCLYGGKIRENKTSQKVKPTWNCMWGCISQASYARAHAQINAKLKHQTLTIHDISSESAR